MSALAQNSTRVPAPANAVARDVLRERASHIVGRLNAIHNRVSLIRQQLLGDGEGVAIPPMGDQPPVSIAESTMGMLTMIGEIEAVLTAVEDKL